MILDPWVQTADTHLELCQFLQTGCRATKKPALRGLFCVLNEVKGIWSI